MAAESFARFVLRVFAWLVCTLFIWWFASPLLAWPLALLADVFSRVALPDLVRMVEQHGDSLTFVTSLHGANATVAAAAGGLVADDIDVRHFTFGLPLLAALILAARAPHRARNLALGYAIVLPFQTWGVVAEFMEDIAVGLGPGVASQTGFSAWEREAIAFAYQFGTLILPTVVPAVVWVLMHRRLVETFARWRAA
ncbi:MAG: exosortase H-associated membrane protein [Casimicrobiaceae bacterium]